MGGGWWFEGEFSVSFGPKPGFNLWNWTWTKLNNIVFSCSCWKGVSKGTHENGTSGRFLFGDLKQGCECECGLPMADLMLGFK